MSIWRKAQWVLIFSILFAFTFGSVGVTYAQSSNGFLDNSLGHLPNGHTVYFADSQGYFGHQQYVCSITSSQLTDIENSYTVSTKQYNVRHHTYEVAVVNLTRKQSTQGLEAIIGKRLTHNCKEYSNHSLLYIFTIPELS
ncbi:MAG TPA: hypothetical protein VMB52_03815 [Verrucomicrobiae bacterium]|nr:hypothetical protein [Verrucomicrobiae bacterium]